MRLVRLAVASVNTTVGAVPDNVTRAVRIARAAAADDATLVALPEQVIGGYPPEDLIQWRGFVDAQERGLRRFAQETADLAAVFAVGLTTSHAGHRFNCAAAIHRGQIVGLVPKEKLPTYNVFYEGRTFARGAAGFFADAMGGLPMGDYLFDFDFGRVALEVCEDVWSPDGPMRRRAYAGAELVVNLSASPFRVGVNETRKEMLATRSADCQATLVYANAVGANDNLIFDGGGFVFQNGRLLLDAPRFREGFAAVTLDLDRTVRLRTENTTFRADWEERRGDPKRPNTLTSAHAGAPRTDLRLPAPPGHSFFLPAPELTAPDLPAPDLATPHASPRRSARALFCEELLDALALGLGDYFEKTAAFKKIGLALSGGRDSLLTLLIAHRYVKKSGRPVHELLMGFTMPSHITGSATREAALAICADLGIPIETIPIADAYDRELVALRSMLREGEAPTRLAKQNIQARIRAQRMWNWANSVGALWLHTGNMSEKAVGYTTIGGDLEGGLSILSNVPKTVVLYLLDYLAETLNLDGIHKTLATVPGPELEHDQAGEDELMPFPVLDACFYLYAAEKLTPREVEEVLVGMFPEVAPERLRGYVLRFAKMFTQSIYKWVQSPLSLHVGNLDLERERALQLPVVQSRAWMEEP